MFGSKGDESAQMPDVVDVALDQAKSQLEGMGLKVTVKNEYDDTIQEYRVIRSSPVAGETVKLGT